MRARTHAERERERERERESNSNRNELIRFLEVEETGFQSGLESIDIFNVIRMGVGGGGGVYHTGGTPEVSDWLSTTCLDLSAGKGFRVFPPTGNV